MTRGGGGLFASAGWGPSLGLMYLVHARLHSSDDVNLGISIQNVSYSTRKGAGMGKWHVRPDGEWTCWEE
jgi:hypothetical protein